MRDLRAERDALVRENIADRDCHRNVVATIEGEKAELQAEVASEHDERMRVVRELGETRRCAHGAEREIREASDALVALGIPEDGRPLAERIRALAPVVPPEIAARHAAIGEDATTMDLGAGWQAHEDRGVLLALRRAPVPAPQTLVDCEPLTPSERAGLVERASPATRTFLAAVKAVGASVADLETVLRAYAVEDRERKAWAAVAPPPEPDIEPAEPSDIWPIDALVYCKVCHKTHAAQAGEKMCGGPGSWIQE
jgi:hypothetical protein